MQISPTPLSPEAVRCGVDWGVRWHVATSPVRMNAAFFDRVGYDCQIATWLSTVPALTWSVGARTCGVMLIAAAYAVRKWMNELARRDKRWINAKINVLCLGRGRLLRQWIITDSHVLIPTKPQQINPRTVDVESWLPNNLNACH